MLNKIKAIDLCTKGFFPKELPPYFKVDSFSQDTLDALGLEHEEVRKGQTYKGKKSSYAKHNLARVGTLRRRLGVPNPVAHAWLSKCLEKNWSDVHGIFQQSEFSCTKPINKPSTQRAFDGEPRRRNVEYRANICSTARVLVKADISRFYHTIYTHSIPWAIHEKEKVKGNHSDELWGNQLDRLFRNLADQQTVGIPIGPDCSQIAAEMILCRIDAMLKAKIGTLKGFRYIDDYEFAVDSRQEGEALLCELQNLLTEYELELNSLKTGIYELPIPFEDLWVCQLRKPNLECVSSNKQRSEIIELFDLAFSAQMKFPRASILRYALRRIAEAKLHSDNYSICEQIVCQCAIVEPSTMRYGFRVLERLHLAGHKFNHFFDAVTLIISDASRKGHGSELCWALYALLRFRRQLPKAGINRGLNEALLQITDPFALLLAVQCGEDGIIRHQMDFDYLDKFFCRDGLWGQNWVLTYEIGELLPNDYLSDCPYFSILKEHEVSFFSDVEECLKGEIELPALGEEY